VRFQIINIDDLNADDLFLGIEVSVRNEI